MSGEHLAETDITANTAAKELSAPDKNQVLHTPLRLPSAMDERE